MTKDLIVIKKLESFEDLRSQLDEIDDIVKQAAWDGYYWSRLNILMGMWEKGKAVDGRFRGVKLPPSYRQLQRETDRGHTDLTKWHDIYQAHPDREEYIEIAKEAAAKWTEKAFRDKLPQGETPLLPSDKFKIIYADPPWKYSDELIETYGAATHHYPVMTITEICDLVDKEGKAVKDLADENAVLFLWVPSPMLDECWPVIEAWGFEFKASFVWDKVKHNYGHYNSVRHEFLLICTRGSCLPEIKELYDSVIEYERSKIHSQKPEYFRTEIIDKLYPSGKAIELFFRGNKKDLPERWDAWGQEA